MLTALYILDFKIFIRIAYFSDCVCKNYDGYLNIEKSETVGIISVIQLAYNISTKYRNEMSFSSMRFLLDLSVSYTLIKIAHCIILLNKFQLCDGRQIFSSSLLQLCLCAYIKGK